MTEQEIQRIERIAGNRPIVKLTNVTVREFCRAARERNEFDAELDRLNAMIAEERNAADHDAR